MVFLIKHIYETLLFVLIVLNFASQIRSDDNVSAGESSGKGSKDVPAKAEKANAQENEAGTANCEDEKDNAKLENTGQEHKNVEVKSEHENSEENDNQCHASNEKQEPEKEEVNDQQANAPDDKSECSKQEASNNDAAASSEPKKKVQKSDANHKTNLNDVNTYNGDTDEEPVAKRETSFPNNDFLGLPRDASYFFDDLEPFINNYSDTRVGRAAPTRDEKIQKAKVAGVKGKESLDEDIEEDDEEDINGEEEKLNEEDYDDDEDPDSDCAPTTGCSATTTTPKCTTTPACTTEPKCTTKCPKLCAKGNKKKIGYPFTTDKHIVFDIEKKKIINKKRRHYSKLNPGISTAE